MNVQNNPAELFVLHLTPRYRLVSVCLGQKNSAVCRRRETKTQRV